MSGLREAWIQHHLMLNLTLVRGGQARRTTVALDDELVAQAQAYTGLTEKTALLREALKALIQQESTRRLIKLGGSDPNATAAPRRRGDAA
jgi:Arc/MetJ family transcription regulator